jgi:UDP-N-acetylglucosamine 2-epimerase (non-hydrolysing)
VNRPGALGGAGGRARPPTMPEEINRVVTDSLCDLHLTPSPDADDNLRAEGVPAACIHFVGNIMIDSLIAMRPAIEQRPHPFPNVVPGRYSIATFHRPANVDDTANLSALVEGLVALSRKYPLIFPVHPRTRQRLETAGLLAELKSSETITLSEPLGYSDFMRCLFRAALVVTDSGGVQEETTFLGIPCFTARASTERPVTVTQGTNRLIRIVDIAGLTAGDGKPNSVPPPALWDGKAAVRIADLFQRYLAEGAPLRRG